VNLSKLLALLGLVCISGLFFTLWITRGTSVSYITESLEVSTGNVQRIYSQGNFYWRVRISVVNSGQEDSKITSIYLSGIKANITQIPPPTDFFSVGELTPVVRGNGSKVIEVYIDSGFSMAAFNKLTISLYSDAGKIYNTNVNLV
jgi:hypothetical protein